MLRFGLVLWLLGVAACGECCADVTCGVGEQCLEGVCADGPLTPPLDTPPRCQPVRALAFDTNFGLGTLQISTVSDDKCISTWTLSTGEGEENEIVWNQVTIEAKADAADANLGAQDIKSASQRIGILEDGKLAGAMFNDASGQALDDIVLFAMPTGCYEVTEVAGAPTLQRKATCPPQ
jgi:hypothetical protein